MASCPYCLEEIKDGARKCPHCQTSFEEEATPDGNTVYVLDKGLVRYAKFVAGVLAVFVVIGLYLYGYDIQEASERAAEAKSTAQQAVLDIDEKKNALDVQIGEINKQIEAITALKVEIETLRAETQSDAAEVRQVVQDLRGFRAEGETLIAEIRTRSLEGTEVSVAIVQREERGIDEDRGKLWKTGSTLKFRFLDGEESLKGIVRSAIEIWGQNVNLTFVESTAADAELRISFEQPGSWSFVGTDALGIAAEQPTVNYGFLRDMADDGQKMKTALHEFGHALGLAHEFQNPDAGEVFDREATVAYYSQPPNNWDTTTIEINVLNKSEQYPGSRAYDRFSIMNYAFPLEIFKPGMETVEGSSLSESDKTYIASLYPKT